MCEVTPYLVPLSPDYCRFNTATSTPLPHAGAGSVIVDVVSVCEL